jgi:hypothetical protein
MGTRIGNLLPTGGRQSLQERGSVSAASTTAGQPRRAELSSGQTVTDSHTPSCRPPQQRNERGYSRRATTTATPIWASTIITGALLPHMGHAILAAQALPSWVFGAE